MRTRAITTALVLLLALAACTAGPDGVADGGQGTAHASAGAATSGSVGAGSAGSGTPAPQASVASPVPTGTGSSAGQSESGASEIIPEASPKPSSLADLVPSDAPSAGRLKMPPPDAIAATGLAAGFPKGVLFVPGGATVVSSAVTTNNGRSQLTLVAAVPHRCSDLLADLRAWYVAGGFTEGAGTRETATRADLTFTRDDGHVTVAALTKSDTCQLTESGVLTAGAGS